MHNSEKILSGKMLSMISLIVTHLVPERFLFSPCSVMGSMFVGLQSNSGALRCIVSTVLPGLC